VVRDLPLADRPVVLVWSKRLWRCPEPGCAVCTWSEESGQIAPRAVLTERARAEIARRVGPAEHSVAQAARDWAEPVIDTPRRGVRSERFELEAGRFERLMKHEGIAAGSRRWREMGKRAD
jgi:hypothetical protein